MNFNGIISNVFNNWTALQLAVENQLGGPQSKEIAEWMVGVTEKFFVDNENLQGWEVGDYLAELVSNEFETEIEDGSTDEIGILLCKFFKLVKESNLEQLQAELLRLPKCNLALCRLQESPEDNEMVPEDSVEALNVDSMSLQETGDKKSKEPIVDEEGFTLVTRSKKK
ncbi:pre-rRNA-processing protein TSR2 homolog [Artemia franciscana]|uniref:Pre-rRNA-processing protein TSR2 homolog n=1 Tax=Artemia franciscana TaxID=6661 RepID=A0AA88II93_ARTSF|nr:hypothetical protein QYM36_003577 [Artemia franciscana]